MKSYFTFKQPVKVMHKTTQEQLEKSLHRRRHRITSEAKKIIPTEVCAKKE